MINKFKNYLGSDNVSPIETRHLTVTQGNSFSFTAPSLQGIKRKTGYFAQTWLSLWYAQYI